MFYSIIRFLVQIIFKVLNFLTYKGRENIPLDKPCIICANHISLLDPVFIIAAVKKRKISFMAKSELFDIPVLKNAMKWLDAFPVSRNAMDISAVKKALKVIKSERALGIFPSGTREFKEDIHESKKGIALLAYKTKANVVPVHIICNGRVRAFKKVKVVIGKPLTYDELGFTDGKNDDLKRVSDYIFDTIYSLEG